MKLIRKETVLDVTKSADVLVVGGGPAGLGAAVTAARLGRKTILLEKRGFLGGNITACYVENCNYFLKGTPFQSEGLYAEIERGCKETFGNDNVRSFNPNAFSSEYLKVYLDTLVQEAGVEVIFHAFVNEVVMEGDRIRAVVVQTKKGPVGIAAEVVIDTTGDADVAFGAGVPFDQGREKDGACQPGTVNLRLAGADTEALSKTVNGRDRLQEIGREFKEDYRAGRTGLPCKRQDIPFGRLTPGGQISYVNYACAYGLDPTDMEDLTRGEIECRKYAVDIYRYLKSRYQEFRNIEIASLAPEIGFRDSRRIRGVYTLTIEDMESDRSFEDVIAVFPRFYDMLAPDGNMEGDGSVEGKGYKGHIYEAVVGSRSFQVPYRSMLPANVSNLLVAGRCMSADHVAESGVRAISLCMMTGQAAGAAATLAVRDRTTPAGVDIRELQDTLRAQGLKLPG